MSSDKINKYKSGGEMVKVGDFDAIKALLERHKETDNCKKLKDTEDRIMSELDALLWYAPKYNKNKQQKDIIKLLLEYGANPNCSDASGVTPIITAAGWNDLETFKLLINNGADPKKCDHSSFSPLYYAIKEESIDIIDYIVKECNIDIDEIDPISGKTVFHYAAYACLQKTIDKLIELGADPTIEDMIDDAIPSEMVPDDKENEELFVKLEEYRAKYKNGKIIKQQKKAVLT